MKARIQNAVILAAGRGKRMGPLTDIVPKPMASLHGETLISREIKKIKSMVEGVHVTVGYKKAMLAEHVIQEGAASVLNTESQSNSWWIFNTLLKNLNEPVYVLTCDNITELDFERLENSYFNLGEPACMLVPVKPVKGLEGDFIFRTGHTVTALDRNRPNDIYCSGIQIIHPAKVNRLVSNEGDFYHVWNSLIAVEQLMVSDIYPKKWTSIDTFEQLARAAEDGNGS